MGLRGIIGFLLVLSIALTFSCYMFENLTVHDTGQKFFSKMISEKLSAETSQEDLGSTERNVRFQCKENGVAYLNTSKEKLQLDCAKMDKIPFNELLANAFYENIYYKDYGCKVLDCFTSTQKIPGLIAGQNHMRYKFYVWYLLAIDVILAVLLFFVCSTWLKRASYFGYVLLISGLGALPFFVTQKIFGAEMAFMNNILYAQLVLLGIGILLLVLNMIFKPKHKEEEDYEDNS